MPSVPEHIAKAVGNETFAKSLALNSQAAVDWALTAVFYAALHYIEAHLATRNLHLRSHITRDRQVATDPNLRSVFHEYSDLKYYSFNTRYEPPQFTTADVRSAFSHLDAIRRKLTPSS